MVVGEGIHATFAGRGRGVTSQPLFPDASRSSCGSLQSDTELQQHLVARGGEEQVTFTGRLCQFNS